jgi:hypothetical protein
MPCSCRASGNSPRPSETSRLRRNTPAFLQGSPFTSIDQDFHESQCSDDGGRDDEHGETNLPHCCTSWEMVARPVDRRRTCVAEVGGASRFHHLAHATSYDSSKSVSDEERCAFLRDFWPPKRIRGVGAGDFLPGTRQIALKVKRILHC